MRQGILTFILLMSLPIQAMDPNREEEQQSSTSFKLDCTICQYVGEKVAKQVEALKEYADDNGITQGISDATEGLAANMRQLKQLATWLVANDEKKVIQLSFKASAEEDEAAALKAQIAQLEAMIKDQNAIIDVLRDDHPQSAPPK